jgi:anti-sigma28 factor (negative regulator of flagellin synthesis)
LESETATIAVSGEKAWEASRLSALSIPDLRSARARTVKAQITAGTYQVTAEQVAGSLLEQMQVSWKAGGHRQSFGA